MLPMLIILLIYMSALIIFVYRHRHRLDLTKILNDIEHKRYWSGALHAIAGECSLTAFVFVFWFRFVLVVLLTLFFLLLLTTISTTIISSPLL